MTVARKIMNTTTEIKITEEDRKAAMELFLNTPSIPVEKVLSEYQKTLDEYCIKFNSPNYLDLVFRADEMEFEPSISGDILDKYSFIERHK